MLRLLTRRAGSSDDADAIPLELLEARLRGIRPAKDGADAAAAEVSPDAVGAVAVVDPADLADADDAAAEIAPDEIALAAGGLPDDEPPAQVTVASPADTDGASAGTESAPGEAWPWPAWARSPAPAVPAAAALPAAPAPVETSPAADRPPMPAPPLAAPGPAPLTLATAGAMLGATPANARGVTDASSLVVDPGPPDPSPRRATGPRVGLGVVPILAGVLLLLLALILGLELVRQPAGQDVLGAIGEPGSGIGLVGAPSTVAPTDETVMPALNRSALRQAILVDERLAAASAALRAELAAARFDAVDVARILRRISADSVYGSGLATIVSGWAPAAQVGSNLQALYTSVHEMAADALVPSVQLESEYRQAAKTMVALLAAANPADDDARAFALAYAVGLPDAGAADSPGASAAP